MVTAADAQTARQTSYLSMMMKNYMDRWGTKEGFANWRPSAQQKEELGKYEGFGKHLRRLMMRDQYYMNMLHRGPGQEYMDANPDWVDPFADDAEGLEKVKQQWVRSYHGMQRQNWINKYGSEEGFNRFRWTPENEKAAANMTPEQRWKYRLRQRTKWYAEQMHRGGPGLIEPEEPEDPVEEPSPWRSYGGGGGSPAPANPATPPLEDRLSYDPTTQARTRSASGKTGWRNYGRGPEGQTVHPNELPPEQRPRTSGKGGY